MGKVILTGILCLMLVHCANKKQHGTFTAAPQTAEDLGYIASLSETELQKIEKDHPEAQVRILSATHDLYEVKYLDEAALTNIVGNKAIEKNFFVQAKDFNKDVTLESLIQNAKTDADAAIKTCKMGFTAPVFQDIQVSFDQQTLSINLGDSAKISAVAKPNPLVGGEVRLLWSLQPPMYSQQFFTQYTGDSQEFTPDTFGFYRIAIIAQGKDLTCAVQVIPLMVTTNPEPIVPATLSSAPNPAVFTHLTDIKVIDAWTMSHGEGIKTAVLDTGINYNHTGIRSNIQMKLQEDDPSDDIDNDKNGFKNDYMGWDFINNDNLPFDDHGHGSHVSGLIASPLLGVAPKSKVIPVKTMNAAGGSDIATITAAIYYAVDSGAQIINASIGLDNIPRPIEFEKALTYANSKNVLFVAASGNGDAAGKGYDIKGHPMYPASMTFDNLISVAATARGQITSYSNFSAELVHVAAPGGDAKAPIYSLATALPNGALFVGMTGTSMATPVTCGVAALMLSLNPNLKPAEIREILMDTGDDLPSLKGKTITGQQINAFNAVKNVQDHLPVLLIN